MVFLEVIVIRMRSSTNIKWLNSLGRFELKPGTRLRDSFIQNSTESLGGQMKEQRGEWISLFDSPPIVNLGGMVVIKNTRKGGKGQRNMDPFYPTLKEMHSPKGSKNS